MTTDIVDPLLPTPHPDDPRSNPTEPGPRDGKVPAGSRISMSGGSSDELSAMLNEAALDPYLDPVAPVEASPSGAPDGPGEPARESSAPRLGPAPDTSSAELANLDVHAVPVSEAETPDGGSFDALVIAPAPPIEPGAIHGHEQQRGASDVGAPTVPSTSSARIAGLPQIDLAERPGAPAKARPVDDVGEEDDYDDEPPRNASWLVVLLASYASAVTIGLIWVLMSHRQVREAEDVDAQPAVVNRVDPGRRADNSRTLAPPPKLSTDKVTTIGKPIRLGDLEITPTAITIGPVNLERAIPPEEDRVGGQNALKLNLRLRNVSKDSLFAPLDEAFVRERDPAVFDSFIERDDGEQIDMFPLSVFSEWEIVGQTFKEIKPGATLVTQVVSASDALERKSPKMTWRVRVRIGIDQTDVFGVAFTDSDIKPDPPSPPQPKRRPQRQVEPTRR